MSLSPRKLSIYCPYCHKHTSIDPVETEVKNVGLRVVRPVETEVDHEGYLAWIATCNFCGKYVFVVESQYERAIFPTPQPSPTDERIKEPARTALVEAKRCLANDAPNACATMARRAIQAAVIEKGAKKGPLIERIDDLKAKGVITPDVATWAHEVRFIGNDGAHPADDVDQEEAEDALKLAEEFLWLIYVTPAIAEERRAKRLEKKGSAKK